MSVTDRETGPLAPAGTASASPGRILVPYGQGRIRGLDADELGAHGAAMDRLVALGLPVVPGLTVPTGAAASLREPGTAEAAVDLVEQLSGRHIGDAARPCCCACRRARRPRSPDCRPTWPVSASPAAVSTTCAPSSAVRTRCTTCGPPPCA